MYIGQTKSTKLKIGKDTLNAKVHYNGAVYFIQVPTISRQYIGDGKTITTAKADAVKTIRKYKWKY